MKYSYTVTQYIIDFTLNKKTTNYKKYITEIYNHLRNNKKVHQYIPQITLIDHWNTPSENTTNEA